MIIKVYPTKDTTICTDYNKNFRTGSEAANLGASPELYVAKRWDTTSGSLFGDDKYRSLMYFDLANYHNVMNYYGLTTSSLSCSLKMYHLVHDQTNPTSFEIYVHPMSRSWDEGNGIDFDEFKDYGYCSWMSATSLVSWSLTGGDYINSVYKVVTFDSGYEHLDSDITDIWNWWIASGNYGLMLKLSDTEETNNIDYYAKKFYSRHADSEIYLPHIEVKVNDVVADRRGSLILNRTGSIYLYNIIDGALEDLSISTNYLNVKLYDTVVSASMSYTSSFYTASKISTGIYKADVVVSSSCTASMMYDIWSTGSGASYQEFLTGTIYLSRSVPSQNYEPSNLNISITNLNESYRNNEYVRLNVFVRNREWNLNTFTANSTSLPTVIIPNTYYEVWDTINNYVHITASEYTKLSYDSSGMYFNLPMTNFLVNHYYEVYFKIQRNRTTEIYKDDNFKFKVTL